MSDWDPVEYDREVAASAVEDLMAPAVSVQVRRRTRVVEHVGFVAAFSVASCVGVFVRCTLPNVDGMSFSQLLFCNALGSFIMGMAVASRNSLEPRAYTVLTTGFCGALTTFSSWQQYASVEGVVQRNVGVAFVAVLVGMAVWISVFAVGKHTQGLGLWFVLAATAVVAVCLAVFMPLTKEAYIGVALGPVGGLPRYMFGLYLNEGIHGRCGTRFPFGTLLSNTLACAIVGVTLLITRNPKSSVIVGVAGALSTVSTFIAEIDGLHDVRRVQYAYAIASFILAQLLLGVFNGFIGVAG
ncbi:Fluoride ion transporter CrcB [Plasmodiophora brassicae]|uniref:Fluoride ion transporter CrcB n=1 Tax=Plasmodiophora brassicae TaxID=37360 RepID=A0A0G4J5V3_PLABS|nr:hypothetical protein PBRA_002874 [Plasmodiophora brassicae]SPQ95012.1 unnamed protein product [Plasmodiophora brassicae]